VSQREGGMVGREERRCARDWREGGREGRREGRREGGRGGRQGRDVPCVEEALGELVAVDLGEEILVRQVREQVHHLSNE